MSRIKIFVFCLAITVVASALACGADFSCPSGKTAACLGYNDIVCSDLAKCVSSDALCFDADVCDYQGFICKSEINALAAEYDNLLRTCQGVAVNHDYRAEENEQLVNTYNDLVWKHNDVVSKYENLKSCISQASTLEAAQRCIDKAAGHFLKGATVY